MELEPAPEPTLPFITSPKAIEPVIYAYNALMDYRDILQRSIDEAIDYVTVLQVLLNGKITPTEDIEELKEGLREAKSRIQQFRGRLEDYEATLYSIEMSSFQEDLGVDDATD